MRLRRLCAALLALVLAALVVDCTRREDAAGEGVLIEDVPHVRQKPDFCGEACAEMYLRKLGKSMDQDYVFDRSGLDPLLGRGCRTAELNDALRKIGFETGDVWHKIDAAKADAAMESQWEALLTDLATGVPSIICTRTSMGQNAAEHFRLVLGYDAESDEVIYHEPAEDEGAYKRMKRDLFLDLWPLNHDARQWTVIRVRLEPGRIEEPVPTEGFTDADYAQHIMELRKKVPRGGFTIVIQRPFVVIGDEAPSMVQRRAQGTVKWAVDKLKKDYFKKDPSEIDDIWLFKDKSSYEKHSWEIFGDTPTTPFGYCSHTGKALVMNIKTGGGTLVHEIVHAFVGSNFPQCPAWFNEGLASLYEQCGDENGHIHGYTNWRLAGLQKAIKAGGVPSFKSLTHTTDYEFYNKDPGTNYAQARYLCYYLQQRGLLNGFYHKFVKNCETDPTGYETLQDVLGEDDMAAFKREWEAFTLGLRFP